MEKLTFNEFCYRFCDGLYDPKLPEDEQSTGYVELKKMVVENITPSSLDEIKRWVKNPTNEELISTTNVKYLTFLHPILRSYVIEHWDIIKTMKI